MLYLDKFENKTVQWYQSLFTDKILKKVKASNNLCEASKAYLSKENIASILIETPENLLLLHSNAPADLRNKEKIASIFDYNNFISKNKKNSYEIASKFNSDTCTYCNRNYTLTIIKDKKELITRPQFDHWFSQKDYPLLALSLYNLIPSCSICNSSIKHEKPLDIKKHIHPHCTDNKEDFKFSYSYKDTIDKYQVGLKSEKNSKMENTLKFFKIKEIYDAHAEKELKDLIDLRIKYNENYLKKITKMLGSQMSNEEAHRLAFGIEIEEKNYHKRPFSKFKKDILIELGIIDSK